MKVLRWHSLDILENTYTSELAGRYKGPEAAVYGMNI